MIRSIRFFLWAAWKWINRLLSSIRIEKLKDLLKDQKKESKDAREVADEDYSDFMHSYEQYVGDSELQRGSEEVREDGSVSEESVGEAGSSGQDSGEDNRGD